MVKIFPTWFTLPLKLKRYCIGIKIVSRRIMKAKGTLLLIGGGEDKGEKKPDMKGKNKSFKDFEILRALLPDGNKKVKRIEVITTASETPAEMERTYRSAFKKIGYGNVGFIKIETKKDARDKKCCERVKKAHAVMFTGGDQFTLSATLGGTQIVAAIKDKFIRDPDFVIAGTSAGAMVMSGIMICEGEVMRRFCRTNLKQVPGLVSYPIVLSTRILSSVVASHDSQMLS
jgi:cyanophycinase